MDTMFINSRNSKKAHPHILLLNPSDKTNLKTSDKEVALSNHLLYVENVKTSQKIMNLRYQLRQEMKS